MSCEKLEIHTLWYSTPAKAKFPGVHRFIQAAGVMVGLVKEALRKTRIPPWSLQIYRCHQYTIGPGTSLTNTKQPSRVQPGSIAFGLEDVCRASIARVGSGFP